MSRCIAHSTWKIEWLSAKVVLIMQSAHLQSLNVRAFSKCAPLFLFIYTRLHFFIVISISKMFFFQVIADTIKPEFNLCRKCYQENNQNHPRLELHLKSHLYWYKTVSFPCLSEFHPFYLHNKLEEEKYDIIFFIYHCTS